MYGVLYAVSPELFPTKDRGTGNAIVATANRVFGIMVCVSLTVGRFYSLIDTCQGSNHCFVCGFIYSSPHLCFRGIIFDFWFHRFVTSFRTSRESKLVECANDDNLTTIEYGFIEHESLMMSGRRNCLLYPFSFPLNYSFNFSSESDLSACATWQVQGGKFVHVVQQLLNQTRSNNIVARLRRSRGSTKKKQRRGFRRR